MVNYIDNSGANRINAAFIAVGGHKTLVKGGEVIPFIKLDKKTIIEHTLDSIVASDVDRIIIWSNHVDRLQPIIQARIDKERYTKPIHVISGKENLTQSLLYALKMYTFFSGETHPFEGDYKKPKEFAKYAGKNQNIMDHKFLTVSCDVPFASPDSINGFIKRYHEMHAKEGSELSVLFAKKDSIMDSLHEMNKISPQIENDFISLKSTLLNYVNISDKPVRVANAYLFMPFLANERAFNIINDVYTIRMFSHLSYWPKIAKLILDYGFNHEDIRKHLPSIAKEVLNVVGSGERLLLGHEHLRKYVKNYFSKGGASEVMNYYAGRILGVKSYIDFNGGLDMMFDVDDFPSYLFAEKHFTVLSEQLKKKRYNASSP